MKLFILVSLILLFAPRSNGKSGVEEVPIKIKGEISSPIMLSKTTVMFINTVENSAKCLVYELNDSIWVEQSNFLSYQINSIINGYDHAHLSISHDFKNVIVSVDNGETSKYYESAKSSGRWGFFKNLVIEERLMAHCVPTFSYQKDHLIAVGKGAHASEELIVLTKNKRNSWSKNEKVSAFKEVNKYVNQAFYINKDNLVFRTARKNKWRWTSGSYYLINRDVNGWSTPIMIKEIDHSIKDLSITPWSNKLIGVSKGKLVIIDLPELLKLDITPKEELITTKTSESISTVKPGGEYYALLIGNENYYNDNFDLNKPVKDIKKLHLTLTSDYTFKDDNIILLENATRNEILTALYKLREKLKSKDNLLIYYAGHGYWDKSIEQGYWFPTDSDKENPSNWLSNSDIREQIKGIQSAHTLLISDACFAGGIFKNRGDNIRTASKDIQLLYKYRSRRAITSGYLSTVPDESVFFRYLNQFLESNEDEFLSSGELFNRLRKGVLNNSMTVPQEGVIMNTGDEGGDFIFIKKK